MCSAVEIVKRPLHTCAFSCPIKPSGKLHLHVRLPEKAGGVWGGGYGRRRKRGNERRGDRFGCDQALPGCDSARLSQLLRLVTAADVPLCSTAREHARAHAITRARAPATTHAHIPPLRSALLCSLTVTAALQAVHPGCCRQ